MGFLVLSIFCSTAIVLLFKRIDQLKVNTFNVIIVNYFTALLLGFGLSLSSPNFSSSIQTAWFLPALIIGIAFVAMFYVIALTSQKAGASVAAVSSRMSVVVPVLFSIIYYSESVNALKIAGIVLALPALAMASWRGKNFSVEKKFVYLPLILFAGSGVVDSAVKYTQHAYLAPSSIMIFSALLFSIAAATGLLLRLLSEKSLKTIFDLKIIKWGIVLGLANWGSLYFFVMALMGSGLDSSLVFVINNCGILILTTLLAIWFFRERRSMLNWSGLLLALVVIFLLSRTIS